MRPPSGSTARLQTQRTYRDRRLELADSLSLERGVRQLLADKISGTLVGLWLLVPEHLRLGTWDLLCSWTGQPTPQVEPRLALQLVHEAALCVTGIRYGRGLSQRGFEVANGLPFVAADTAIHDLLNAHTVAQGRTLQIGLGLLRRAREPLFLFAQRCGQRPGHFEYKSFASTRASDEVQTLTDDFPSRWHIEQFFDAHQALGWKRAGTLNLNVRYGQMSLALVAQAALSQLRQRLGAPYSSWEADHFARKLLGGLDGDVRVHQDTIVVTFYNAPVAEAIRSHFVRLPDQLVAEGVDPHIPWLYNFKLDFRFQ